jgi:type IV secretion system protein VirB10
VSTQNPPGATNPYGSQDPQSERADPRGGRYAAEDLDAATPVLRSSEAQRLNRRALMFLAAIVVLLLLMAFWMVRSATADEEEGKGPREETVVIPELPQTAARAPALPPPVDPIALAPQPELPPLPPRSPVASAPPPFAPDMPMFPRGPTLQERRMMMEGAADPSSGTGAAQTEYLKAMLAAATGKPATTETPKEPPTSAHYIRKPDALLVRGTYIRCVLETRITTDISGFTSCVVTEPVYSINGRSLLLPKGAKVSGRYGTGDRVGPRVAVVWDRITTPNGIDVTMASPGVDNLGGAGHPGDYDAHWGSRITSALLISLISDGFKIAAAEHGPPTTTVAQGVVIQEPYESNTARTMERLANEALSENLRRPPTVTIQPGEIINIYVAKDVDFSAVLGT